MCPHGLPETTFCKACLMVLQYEKAPYSWDNALSLGDSDYEAWTETWGLD
jgi:hypothetical protein